MGVKPIGETRNGCPWQPGGTLYRAVGPASNGSLLAGTRQPSNPVLTIVRSKSGHSFASNVNPLPKLRELVPVYRRARAEAGHGPSGGDDLTLLMPLYVGDDRRSVERAVTPSVRHFAETAAAVFQGLVPKAPEAERPKLQAIVEQLCGMSYHTVNAVTGIFDTPSACVERLHQIREEFNPGRVICWFNFGDVIPHDRVMRSMELFSTRVLPHV